MKRITQTMVVMGAVVVLAAGCATSKHVPGAERIAGGNYLFTSTATALVERPGETKEITRAQVAAMALARAELLKTIKGVQITETVTVEDLMLTKQAASMKAEGWISRATITVVPAHRTYDDDIVIAEGSLVLSRKDLEDMKQFVE